MKLNPYFVSFKLFGDLRRQFNYDFDFIILCFRLIMSRQLSQLPQRVQEIQNKDQQQESQSLMGEEEQQSFSQYYKQHQEEYLQIQPVGKISRGQPNILRSKFKTQKIRNTQKAKYIQQEPMIQQKPKIQKEHAKQSKPQNLKEPKPQKKQQQQKSVIQQEQSEMDEFSNQINDEQIEISAEMSNEFIQKSQSLDLIQLSVLSLTYLQQLELIDILLRDQGIQQLSQQHFEKMENLRSINLNGNDISVAGLGHIVLNSWHKRIVYVLDVVKIKNNHFGFHAGESIPIMKDCLCQGNTQISHDQIDRLQRQNKAKLFQALYLMLQIPFQTLAIKQSLSSEAIQQSRSSEQIQQQLQKQSKLFTNSQKIVLFLKSLLEQSEVSFSQKSNIRSQLSMKVLFSGMQYQRIMFEYRYKQNSKIFDNIKGKFEKMIEYQRQIKKHLMRQYGFPKEDIIIHKLFKGSTKVSFSLDIQRTRTQQNMKEQKFQQDLKCEKVVVIPYFQSFNLTQQDFDVEQQERRFSFPKHSSTKVDQRGGVPYFMPVHCTRFGIRVKYLYDNKNNRWIEMDGRKGQWGICFHGIQSPEYICRENITRLKSIMMGRERGQMLKPGEKQKYTRWYAVNKQQQVGNGIYCSPLFTTALQFASQCKRNEETYYILLQARFKPEALKITDQQSYWVINQSMNFRPYGLILVTSAQYQILLELKQEQKKLYPDDYIWQSWKHRFQKFQNQPEQ